MYELRWRSGVTGVLSSSALSIARLWSFFHKKFLKLKKKHLSFLIYVIFGNEEGLLVPDIDT
jgi:hypothetical protein